MANANDPIRGQDPSPQPSTATGLAPNVAGALAYLLGPVTGILFLVLEKQNPFVRFHAAQSIGLSVAWIVLWMVLGVVGAILGVVPLIGWIVSILMFLLSAVIGLAGLALWLFLMYQALRGEEWEFPWIGEQSRSLLLGGGGSP